MKINECSNIWTEEVFDIASPEVSISTISSDVRITESPDGKCHVTIYGKSQRPPELAELVQISSHGEMLSVRVDRRNTGFRGLFGAGSAALFVLASLPNTTELKVNAISADVEVNPAVRRIDVESISGDIVILHNPAGVCNLKTMSGDISTTTFSSCQYALKSISGDIKVLVAPGLEVDVDGKTISGDLASEISLDANAELSSESSELVSITTSTVSGNFTLARN
jgi:hypothetical protein